MRRAHAPLASTMAGMEQLEIHSKSYLVRWVEVKAEHTISWTIQPHKKSINFGIFKHPGSGIAPTPRLPSATFEAPPTPGLKPGDGNTESDVSQSATSAAAEKLRGIGLRLMKWHGSCEANLVTTGKYDVARGEGGMYALVFDNTFSKQVSKTVTFALLTYPTNAAPQTSHHVHHTQSSAATSTISVSKARRSRPKLNTTRLPSDTASERSASAGPSTGGLQASEYVSSTASTFHTGVLQKRRRKRGQGWARRFFSLDYTTATLSYYHDRSSLNLRGSVPLALAAIAANELSRQISIDSGAEVWHLKALNKRDFVTWRDALDRATARQPSNASDSRHDGIRRTRTIPQRDLEDEREWVRIEDLVSRVGLCRDMARNLAKDTDPKYATLSTSYRSDIASGPSRERYPSSSDVSLVEPGEADKSRERRPFWMRKVSGGRATTAGRSSSVQEASPNRLGTQTIPERGRLSQIPASLTSAEEGIHEQCMDLLKNLDAIAGDFTRLLAEARQRRAQVPVPLESRVSIDTVGSQEFYDAEQGDGSQLLVIRESGDEEAQEAESAVEEQEHFSPSESEDMHGHDRSSIITGSQDSIFPPRPKGLDFSAPGTVVRRSNIQAPSMSPPSLIGFLRKNVGKDLSTISMPVSANEPISLLQKAAEQLEYSALLDEAANASLSSTERLLYVTAFAISSLSSFRVKERAIRKPFNPLLGETYELIREDRGFRFVAEKVSHRPVRLACQADAEQWSLSQSPSPTQKFWGKSAELITEGSVRIVFHDLGQHFVYSQPTCALRNLIAGEKYVEPTGTMTVENFDTGESAVVTFKSRGMFSGRSEVVVVQTYSNGRPGSLGLAGKWTEQLNLVVDGVPKRAIWSVGDLVTDAANCYGFPTFTASLNDRSSADAGLPPTDSRLRPDQRAVEDGDVDRAEALKAQQEQAQRDRRMALEERGEEWQALWFVKLEGTGGEDIWKMKVGKDGYWDAQARGDWRSAPSIFK